MFLAFKLSDIVTVPFGWLLGYLYDLTSNYGIAMIIFAVIVQLVLLPINAKSKKSMMKMSGLQPKIQKIQRKYANDQQKQNEAIQKLQQEEGASMGCGGCLWSLVPLLILIPLYSVIRQPIQFMLHESAETVTAIIRSAHTNLVRLEKNGQILMHSGTQSKAAGSDSVIAALKNMTVAQLDQLLDEAFTFDNFRWQQENKISVDEPFRADGLNRLLYKCPHCGTEGNMVGKGIKLTCHNCGAEYELTETGFLKADNAIFTHVPDWFNWQRQEIRKELESGSYNLDIQVDIAMLVNYNALYMVGEGRLTHTVEGFHLTGCDGKLDYTQGPVASHCLNADYFWYEIGDMIGIGNQDTLYFCFPKNCGDVVAKTRLATEELYKLHQDRDFHLKHCGECPHHHHLSQE